MCVCVGGGGGEGAPETMAGFGDGAVRGGLWGAGLDIQLRSY